MIDYEQKAKEEREFLSLPTRKINYDPRGTEGDLFHVKLPKYKIEVSARWFDGQVWWRIETKIYGETNVCTRFQDLDEWQEMLLSDECLIYTDAFIQFLGASIIAFEKQKFMIDLYEEMDSEE